jgi:hypothetical protein
LISFQTNSYNQLLQEKQTTVAESKIDFLMRFGPKLRDIGRSMLEEFEVLWLKYEASRGYQFTKFQEQDDNIYLLYSGTARMLVPSQEHH